MKNVKTNQMNARRCNSEGAGVKMTSWLNNNFKLLALTLLAVLSVNVWGEEVTLTLNNIGAELSSNSEGSSGTTDVTATGSSTSTFTLNYGNAYQYDNNNAILLKKGTDGGTSFISNKTPMPGNIVSAIVYTAAGSSGKVTYYCSFKTTECTSRYATGTAIKIGTESSYTYNCTVEDAKYFCIAIGNSNNGQVIRIDVTYEAAGPSCTTPPTVSSSLSNTSSTTSSITATVGITSIGGCDITENGLVYSTTNPTPTVGGTGCSKETVTACGSTAANKIVTISGLACGQSYYVCGYATNAAGTRYSNVSQISTSACPVDHFIDNVQGTAQQDKQGNGYTIPSCSDQTKGTGCAGEHYKFIGWSSTQIQAGTQPTEPAGLLKAGNKHDATGATYYAVWAAEENE